MAIIRDASAYPYLARLGLPTDRPIHLPTSGPGERVPRAGSYLNLEDLEGQARAFDETDRFPEQGIWALEADLINLSGTMDSNLPATEGGSIGWTG